MGKYTVAVAGATGYAGGEMLRILATHPQFEVTTVTGHSSVGESLGKFQPHIPQLADLIVQDSTPEVLNGHDVVVFALPHGASGALAAQIDEHVVLVDLGADHRLEDAQAWNDYYGGAFYEHWAYGMPELIIGKHDDGTYAYQQEQLVGATRIAGPGCNVTAVTLAMQPALANNLIIPHTTVANLAVGYSGAGKNLSRMNLLAAEALNSAVPYGVGGTHRHIPEILQNFAHAAGLDATSAKEFTLAFTPILVPMSRGILASVSAQLTDKALQLSDEQIHDMWGQVYGTEGFIRVLEPGVMPATQNVLGSNAAHVQVAVDRRSRTLHAFAAIDNLNRGTAGQAVESLNIAFGLAQEEGLSKIGVAP